MAQLGRWTMSHPEHSHLASGWSDHAALWEDRVKLMSKVRGLSRRQRRRLMSRITSGNTPSAYHVRDRILGEDGSRTPC
jgi:hypothetical protein